METLLRAYPLHRRRLYSGSTVGRTPAHAADYYITYRFRMQSKLERFDETGHSLYFGFRSMETAPSQQPHRSGLQLDASQKVTA